MHEVVVQVFLLDVVHWLGCYGDIIVCLGAVLRSDWYRHSTTAVSSRVRHWLLQLVGSLQTLLSAGHCLQ